VTPRRSRVFDSLPGYPLADMPARRSALEARGVDVIDLGTGDADLPPPPAVVDRLRDVVGQPEFSRYPFQFGLRAFREAVASWMVRRFGVRLDPEEEIVPLIGSKEGIAKLPFAFLDPGDVSVIPDPGYRAYLGGTVLAGAEPYLTSLTAGNGFLPDLEGLPPDVARRTRLVYLNYPNNPTTATAPRSYLSSAVAFCRERDAILIHDHAYSEIAFDGYRPPSVLEIDGAREVAIEFHSVSKTYNMTGWRLGWAAGASPVVAALAKVKTFMDTGAFLAVQAAGVAALESWERWVPGNVAEFQRRRDAGVEALRTAGFDVDVPRATMYLWVAVPRGTKSESFAHRALEEQGVAILPGTALGRGGEGYVRLALTVPPERLREAAERLGHLLR
jgi:LL-diaminopimelate aminotransferase